MVSSSRHWHIKLHCRTIPTRSIQEERRTASSPLRPTASMLRATLISRRLQYDPTTIPPPSSRPGCLGPLGDESVRTVGRLHSGQPGERLPNQRPEVSAGMASCDHSTPGAIAEGSDLQLPVEKTHLFSDADALLAAPQSSTLRNTGARTFLACNRSLTCKCSATGDKSQDRTAPFVSQTPCSNKGRPLCRLSYGPLDDYGTHKFGRRVHDTLVPSSLIALVIGIWLAPSSLPRSSVLRRGVRGHEHDPRADGKEFAIQFF